MTQSSPQSGLENKILRATEGYSFFKSILGFFLSLRPHQWVKNFLLFAGLIFSRNFFKPDLFFRTVLAFGIFCLLTGGLYVINDLFDLKKDREHPSKCKRPLAKGMLPAWFAGVGAAVCLGIAVPSAFLLERNFGFLCLTYFILNLFYSFYLKHLVIIDVFVLGIDFVIRAVAGACVIFVSVSHWLILCTFLLSLFLGFGKRRQEIILLGDNAHHHRRSLSEYSAYFLDQMISIVTAATVMSYALYTVSAETIEKFHTDKLIYTVPFVLFGIFRYLYLVYQRNEGGNPTRTLLTDLPIQINIVLWLLVIVGVIYVAPHYGL